MNLPFLYLICYTTLFIVLTFATIPAEAQLFGLGKKKDKKETNPASEQDDDIATSIQQVQLDANEELLNLNDPDLQEAMQMFADMSPDEMMDTIKSLQEEFKDDPELLAELDTIMEELSQLDSDEIQASLDSIMNEEMTAKSMVDTLDMLKNADDNAWETIMENKDAILQVVIESGIMTQEEVELFQNDGKAWEEELEFLWKELKQQANDHNDGGTSPLLGGGEL